MSNEQQSGKMWSGRFREPLNPLFEAWQRSLRFDWRLLPYELAASKAHARTIAAAGVLTPEELATILRGLDAIIPRTGKRAVALYTEEFRKATSEPGIGKVMSMAPGIRVSKAEDVHHYVELELTEEIGELALKLHTGRSRNEQIATDLRLYVRDCIEQTTLGIIGWASALVEKARTAGDSVMPSYTHLQRAEPVLVAHWLLAYVEMALRDASRLADCAGALNLCPLGSGAVAGATLALDRSIAASELGFAAPTANSIDATSDRDFILEYLASAGIRRPAHSAVLPKRSRSSPLPSSASSICPKASQPAQAPCRRRRIPISPSCCAANAAVFSALPSLSRHF